MASCYSFLSPLAPHTHTICQGYFIQPGGALRLPGVCTPYTLHLSGVRAPHPRHDTPPTQLAVKERKETPLRPSPGHLLFHFTKYTGLKPAKKTTQPPLPRRRDTPTDGDRDAYTFTRSPPSSLQGSALLLQAPSYEEKKH